MKKALFIDRDGTILVEPPIDFQIDSIDKFQFVSGAISGLKTLSTLGYELVMASNQDGLGTHLFPTEDFLPLQRLMLDVLRSEGVVFDDILIDPTLPEDNAPTRKPGTGMFGKYLDGSYDLAASYVIGDRDTDAMLAQNLGARFLRIGEHSWEEIATLLSKEARTASITRRTRETDVSVSIILDDSSPSCIDTGLKFFDHMLSQIATHAGIHLDISAKGDLEVDEHHTMEDVAITLGTALLEALGDKRGIGRYGCPADGQERSTRAARLRRTHRFRVGRSFYAPVHWRHAHRDVPARVPVTCIGHAVQPSHPSQRRKQPPPGRSRLQSLRTRPQGCRAPSAP